MFEVHPSNWPLAVDSADPRNQFHERALHEARVATERRGSMAEPAVSRPRAFALLRQLRANGRAVPATEPCACAA
jgi:hypothetical protein